MLIPRFSSEHLVHAKQSKHQAQIFLHFLSHQTKDQTHFNQNHQTHRRLTQPPKQTKTGDQSPQEQPPTITNRASQFTKKRKKKNPHTAATKPKWTHAEKPKSTQSIRVNRILLIPPDISITHRSNKNPIKNFQPNPQLSPKCHNRNLKK